MQEDNTDIQEDCEDAESPGFASDASGGYNAVTRAYKADPTIKHCVRLRREQPDAEIEVAIIGGIDQLFFMEPELRRYGFDPEVVVSVLDADPCAISEVSLQIMERIIEARELEDKGETHLARRGLVVPDKLIDWLIACMLDALSWNDRPYIPRDLIVLIRERLGAATLPSGRDRLKDRIIAVVREDYEDEAWRQSTRSQACDDKDLDQRRGGLLGGLRKPLGIHQRESTGQPQRRLR